MVIKVDDRTITVMHHGYVGIARCNPDDDFNLMTGIKLALSRAIPQQYETYYFKSVTGIIVDSIYAPDVSTVCRLNRLCGNYYRTPQAAKVDKHNHVIEFFKRNEVNK